MRLRVLKNEQIRLESENGKEIEIIERIKNADCLKLIRSKSTTPGVAIFERKLVVLCIQPRGGGHGADQSLETQETGDVRETDQGDRVS